MAAVEVDWDVCEDCEKHDGIGIRLPSGGKCWAHADDQDLDAALKGLGEGGKLDARGVSVTTQLLGRLLHAAPASRQRRRWLGDVCFEHATFEQVDFPNMTFKGEARFAGATFNGPADFKGATFTRKAEFPLVTFKRGADFHNATFNGEASFEEATFGATASFTGATFDHAASFRMAMFERWADFNEVTFNRAAEFNWAKFKDAAWFAPPLIREGDVERQISLEGALVLFPGFDPLEHGWVEPTEGSRRTVFNGEAQFGAATFDVLAWFHGVTFRYHADFKGVAFDLAWFDKATFKDSANFDEVTVNRVAGFRGTAFRGIARFIGARFNGLTTFDKAIFTREAVFLFTEFSGAWFRQTTFYDKAMFVGASFKEGRHLGPMVVGKELNLDGAVFSKRVSVEIAAAACSCRGTQFLAEVEFRVRWAHLVLDDTGFAAPSLLIGVAPFNHIDERQFARAWAGLDRPSGIQDARPRLLSLQRVDAARLSIFNVDLGACRFAAAHNLDQLHIERSSFGSTPNGWRWTARQTIAEEHHWRSCLAATWRRRGWYDQSTRPPAWLKVEPLDPAQIATVYRALRKGREDSKDEPGAADFYYGEMEMRRHAAPRFSVERFVLFLYWLFSGYALRAWRAFVTLGAVLVLTAWLLAHYRGFATPHAMTFWSALRYSGRTAIGLLPKDQPTLTPLGDVLQIAVRILVPVLLGLAALSIRGRVKR
jgi:uncharacterized protein YjbI with pentapeptide repeats